VPTADKLVIACSHLVLIVSGWLGATATTKAVYSFEDKQRQKKPFTHLKTNEGKNPGNWQT
jgi:hypothetical protein